MLKGMRAAVAASLALLVSACVSTGSGYGVPQAGDGGRAQFHWDARDTVSGELKATLPDGGVYEGTYFQITSETRVDRLGPMWWDGWRPGWRWPYWDRYPGPEFVKHYSGRVVANLVSNEGDHMRCQFQLVHPTEGMSGGGQGECQTSDGESIDATFPNA